MEIVCPVCGGKALRRADSIARNEAAGLPTCCSKRCGARARNQRLGHHAYVQRRCHYRPCGRPVLRSASIAQRFDRSYCCKAHELLDRYGSAEKPCGCGCGATVVRTGKRASADSFFVDQHHYTEARRQPKAAVSPPR